MMRLRNGVRAVLAGFVLAACERDPAQPNMAPEMAASGQVTSYVWKGMWGSFGDGPGQFRVNLGLAVREKTGNIYVTDLSHRVQVFDRAGIYLTEWGGIGSEPGLFNYPSGVAVSEKTGAVYVADGNNQRVQVFDAGGSYLTQWGSYGSAPGQFSFSGPLVGIAVNPKSGDVYVADPFNNRIQVFDASGTYLREWGGYGQGPGQFTVPQGVAIASKTGDVYVVSGGNRIQRFDGAGTYLGEWADGNTSLEHYDLGVAVDAKTGNVFVTDTYANSIRVFDPAGNYLTEWGTTGGGDGQFQNPAGVAVHSKTGAIYINDYGNFRVQIFAPTKR